jgi:hypothetical protein
MKGNIMQEKAIYFGKSDIYQKIKNIGGEWNDTKVRPLVCLTSLSKNSPTYRRWEMNC